MLFDLNKMSSFTRSYQTDMEWTVLRQVYRYFKGFGKKIIQVSKNGVSIIAPWKSTVVAVSVVDRQHIQKECQRKIQVGSKSDPPLWCDNHSGRSDTLWSGYWPFFWYFLCQKNTSHILFMSQVKRKGTIRWRNKWMSKFQWLQKCLVKRKRMV